MRPFDTNDWSYLAGTERFEDGTAPLVGEVKLTHRGYTNVALILAARGRVDVLFAGGDGYAYEWRRSDVGARDAVVGLARFVEGEVGLDSAALVRFGFEYHEV